MSVPAAPSTPVAGEGPEGATRPARRADPRVAQTRWVVLEAAYRLLAEQGLAGATVEKLTEYSGVSRSTIYRHWPKPSDLYVEALTSPVSGRAYDAPSGGDVVADLLAYGLHLADRLNDPLYAAAFAALLAEARRDPVYGAAQHDFITERSRRLVDLLEAGVARGQLRADLDVREASSAFIGPFVYDCFLLQRRITVERVQHLVDRALADWGPGANV